MRRSVIALVALLVVSLLLGGCNSVEKKRIRENPPPIQAGGGPMDPMATPPVGEAPTAPAEGEAMPAEGEAAPAEGEAMPAEGEAAPAEGEAAPAEGEAAPAEGETAPAPGG